jgi:hypothetical protein
MIERVDITPEEFDRRKDRLRSRWAQLIECLKAGAPGEVFSICLRNEANTGKARQRARQSIYAIARHHGIRIRISSSPLAILVMKCGAAAGCEVCPECRRTGARMHSPASGKASPPAAGASTLERRP